MPAAAHSEHAAALAAKIKPVRFAMFTTVDADERLVSQPMTLQQADEDGGLWFFTSTLTGLWENIAHRPEVNLAFADPGESLFVSVSGTAERVVDRERIRSMWNTMVQAWFPNGPEDEHAVLVRVAARSAEYWDSNESKMVQLFDMAKAALTGTTPETGPGEHGRIDI